MNGELQQFAPIGLLVIVAVAFVSAIVFLPSLLAKKRSFSRLKDTPYECGIPADAQTHTRFSVKFYLVAMLFILFDIEVVFMVGWATVFRDMIKSPAEGGIGWLMLGSALLFIAILEVGHFYIWRKGALNWAPRRPAIPSE